MENEILEMMVAGMKQKLIFSDMLELQKIARAVNIATKAYYEDKLPREEIREQASLRSKSVGNFHYIEGHYIKHEWRRFEDYPEPPDENEVIQDKQSKNEWNVYRDALEKFSYKHRLLEMKSDPLYTL